MNGLPSFTEFAQRSRAMWMGATLAALSFILLVFLVLNSFGAAITAGARQQFFVAAGACEFVGGILLLISYREVRLWLWLLEEGCPAQARITAIERIWFRPFPRATHIIHYSYRDSRGQIYAGRSGYLTGSQVEGWRVGSQGVTYYDPARPDRSVWTGSVQSNR